MPAITGFTTGEVLTAANVNQYLLFGNENRIINGDMSIWQRGASFTTMGYTADRWQLLRSVTACTVSQQSFTLGNPITGQEPRFFLQAATTSSAGASDYVIVNQRIESVRTLAGRTATVSFWARATSGTPRIGLEVNQNFGTGGSPSADVSTPIASVTLSTSWVRYTYSVNVPSISGRTIGSNNNDYLELNFWLSAGSTWNTRASSIGAQTATFQIWGVKVESGAVATPFLQRPQQVELALCQRYHYRLPVFYQTCTTISGIGNSYSNTLFHKVTMRRAPDITAYSGGDYGGVSGRWSWYIGSTPAVVAVSFEINTPDALSGVLAGYTGYVFAVGSYIADAEL